MNKLNMGELLQKCLNANYVHTENAGDYAIEIVDKVMYLMFQWSNGIEDWKNNFNFPARSYKWGANKWYCHSGFHRVWRSIRDQLEPRVVVALINNTKVDTIVCVGFSHGAPLAGFATEDMEFIYGSCYKVLGYGFGCPRFTWGYLPKAVKERFKHFTPIRNIPDIVTHVPPAILGYGHGGKLMKIGSPKKYGLVDAHRPESYLEELRLL